MDMVSSSTTDADWGRITRFMARSRATRMRGQIEKAIARGSKKILVPIDVAQGLVESALMGENG